MLRREFLTLRPAAEAGIKHLSSMIAVGTELMPRDIYGYSAAPNSWAFPSVTIDAENL
jgi:hypothetical protein